MEEFKPEKFASQETKEQKISDIERLLEKNETLYGKKPSFISELVGEKLNQLTQADKEVKSIVAIPDYHSFGSDGGVKDILFVTKIGEQKKDIYWETATVLGSDKKTMCGIKTAEIQLRLTETIKRIEKEGNTIEHIIPITDSHESAIGAGFGGMDGLKDLIICFRKRKKSE